MNVIPFRPRASHYFTLEPDGEMFAIVSIDPRNGANVKKFYCSFSDKDSAIWHGKRHALLYGCPFIEVGVDGWDKNTFQPPITQDRVEKIKDFVRQNPHRGMPYSCMGIEGDGYELDRDPARAAAAFQLYEIEGGAR